MQPPRSADPEIRPNTSETLLLSCTGGGRKKVAPKKMVYLDHNGYK